MASLHYKFATMNSGKSTQLIQAHFNYLERGMVPLAMTPVIDDRFGTGVISARVGLELKVEVFSDSCDLFEMVKARHGEKGASQSSAAFSLTLLPSSACSPRRTAASPWSDPSSQP